MILSCGRQRQPFQAVNGQLIAKKIVLQLNFGISQKRRNLSLYCMLPVVTYYFRLLKKKKKLFITTFLIINQLLNFVSISPWLTMLCYKTQTSCFMSSLLQLMRKWWRWSDFQRPWLKRNTYKNSLIDSIK